MRPMSSSAPTSRSWPLAWISRDAWLIISARSLRGFAQTSIGIVLAIYLDLLGFSLAQIGLFFSLGIAGSALFSVAIVFFGNAVGRRVLLAGFTVLTGATGIALALTDQFVLLAFIAFVGSFNVGGGGPAGPVQPLERASMAETAPAERRTDMFAIYSMSATGVRAFGALGAALPILFQRFFGLDELPSFKVMFAGYALVSLLAGLLYLLLSPAVEGKVQRRAWTNPFRLPSRRLIFSIAGLFALDSFATRLIMQAIVALWFHTRFGFELQDVAFLFVGSTIMNTISIWVGAKIANRYGLVNAIVLTHVPAVVTVIAIPFMPNAGTAVALWLARAFFSQMDVGTKQSYTMAIVDSDERVAMAGVSNVAQSGLGILSPLVALSLLTPLWIGAPFVATGVLKGFYLLGFYRLFRRVRPPEEQAWADSAAGATASGREVGG